MKTTTVEQLADLADAQHKASQSSRKPKGYSLRHTHRMKDGVGIEKVPSSGTGLIGRIASIFDR